MIRVYVSGPITQGDQFVNCRNAILAGQELLMLGLCPFIPHANVAWNMVCPNPYEIWMKWDLEWLRQCHALLRLHGSSHGADREERLARDLGIPVFYSVEELRAWSETKGVATA